jgi:hypothetical protein
MGGGWWLVVGFEWIAILVWLASAEVAHPFDREAISDCDLCVCLSFSHGSTDALLALKYGDVVTCCQR